MVIRRYTIFHLSILTLIIAGCSGPGPMRFRASDLTPPQDLTANASASNAPDQPVTVNPEQNVARLETRPAGINDQQAEPWNDPQAGQQPETAAGGAPASIGRTDLLGGWKVAAGSDTCELFMSLTGWTGGYRATTRGCSSALLANVQAWNLNDQEITLVNGGGETVARLFAATKVRFNGQTEDGIGVTVFR